LTLVGILSYDKGDFAFFDGSRSEFKKALPVGKSIAGYKVAAVNTQSVQLTQDTNTVELHVGMQMHRKEGAWEIVSSSRSRSAIPVLAEATAAGSSSEDDDIVKKLMRQREAELK
jgi:hypothetical protein